MRLRLDQFLITFRNHAGWLGFQVWGATIETGGLAQEERFLPRGSALQDLGGHRVQERPRIRLRDGDESSQLSDALALTSSADVSPPPVMVD